MKFSTKILVSFLAIIILTFFQLVITQKFQNDILDNMKQTRDVEAPLQLLVQRGISYGSIATMQIHISILHSQVGEYSDIRDHKLIYDAVEMKLDDIFNEDARILLNQSNRPQEMKDSMAAKFKEIGRLNLLMRSMGIKAFAAIDAKDIKTAYSLLVGGDYEKYQQEVQLAAKDLAETVDKDAFDIHNVALGRSQQVIYTNLVCSLVNIIILLIVLFILRSFIAEKEKEIVTKEKELNIREKMEQKYRILFENASDAIFIADAETRRLVDCNESAENLMGYSRDELLSMKADELHPKDKIKETMEGFKKQAEGKIKSISTEVLTKNNQRIPVIIDASAVLIGNKHYSQGMFIKLK